MAHIFKNPTLDSKGIIVFTHKEWPFLLDNALSSIQELKEYYYLGWNQGTYFGNLQNFPSIIDFTLASPTALNYPDNGSTQKIDLMDRNFLLSDYKNMGIKDRFYDIISISRAIKIKNVPSLLQAVRKLNDKKIYPKTLIIIPVSEMEVNIPEKYDLDIVKQYEELFNYEERKNITLLRLSPELGFLGVSPQTINWLYNNSKVLYIGSKSEGGCRVTHEALLCGCDIVYYKDHQGPMVDYLNSNNSVPFNDYNTIDEALDKAYSKYSYNESQTLKFEELLSERHALKNLTPHFNKLYKKNNQVFDGKLINCDNLSNRLPAHHIEVPWNDDEFPTADILSIGRLTKFITYLNEQTH